MASNADGGTLKEKPVEYKDLKTITEQIESCGYECIAGPLHMNVAWEQLKNKTELYIVVNGNSKEPVQHTNGNGGWGFMVFTNEAEARSRADQWNRDNHGGMKVLDVKHLLGV